MNACHILCSKTIANNTEIDVIYDDFQQKLDPLREKLNKAVGESWEEWEIPRELTTEYTENTAQSPAPSISLKTDESPSKSSTTSATRS